jgi:hypothetical protein
MSSTTDRARAGSTVAARVYGLICLVALFVILLEEMAQVRESAYLLLLAVLPSLAGGLGLVTRSNLASLLLLVALAGRIIIYQAKGWLPWYAGRTAAARFQASDLLLCSAVLAFVIAHYRLMGLVQTIFPRDPRRQPAGPRRGEMPLRGTEPDLQPRSAELVQPLEWAFLIMGLPVWVILAQLVWRALPGQWTYLEMPDWLLKWTVVITPAWLLAAILIFAAAFFGYWGRRNMTAAEGHIALQDDLWHETRREQRWVGRWLAWARLRRPGGGGSS